MELIDSIFVRYIRFWQLECVHLNSRTMNFYFYILLYSSIDWFFTLNPQTLCDSTGWGIRSQLFFFFPHWVYGFSYEAAQVNSLAWIYLGIFPYHSLLMMLNSVCYLDGNKHWGSQFELQTHSRLLVVNINRIKTRSLFKHGNLLRHV